MEAKTMPDASEMQKRSWFSSILPALTLMVMAPLIAEVLPGATRISSIFVFPIEILIWGGGAVMARYLVRKYKLGWFNLLLLALALSVAEEVLIQQTSVAPMVIKLKGVEYARAFDINYVYFLWALLYEAIFVVLIPVGLTELIFPSRKNNGWLNRWGIGVIVGLFFPACFMAWYSWTQIARTKVFHLPDYQLPVAYAAAGAAVIAVLLFLAVGPVRRMLAAPAKPLAPPHPVVIFVLAAAAAVVMFGLCVLGFGIQPAFPPMAAVAVAVVLAAILLLFTPRFMAHEKWSRWHDIAAQYGMVLSNFAVMFAGFIGAAPIDLYGKTILDVVAVLLMLWLMLVRQPRKA